MIADTTRDSEASTGLTLLRQLNLLDTPAEEAFDRLTRLAARILQAPICLLSLIDDERQVLKSTMGLPEACSATREVPLIHSICQYVVVSQAPLVVEDGCNHPLFSANPHMIALGVTSYAGVPLITEAGQVLGALCVMDRQPRAWTNDDVAMLTDFAALTMTEIALRSDILERQRVEAELREDEKFLRSIYDGVSEAIFVMEHEPSDVFRCISTNLAHERGTNVLRSVITGLTPEDIFPPEIAAGVIAHYRECVTYKAPITYEEHLQFGDEMTWWLTTLHPLHDSTGRVFRIIGTSINITDFKRAEEERRALERKLLELQKYESMGVLASGVAHDFNNMLAAILGNLELAVLELPPASTALSPLKQIEAATRRAADLTRQMLAYSGKATLVSQRINLNMLVAEMTHLLHISIPKRTKLECDFQIVPMIEGDPTQLRQVIMNLVLNAAESIGDVPGQIVVTTAQVEANARYLAEAHFAADLPPGVYVALTVADTGCGMDVALQARMFDPFFTTKPAGHGLGLAAVLGIIRRHRGALRVESMPDVGTRFTILLPIHDSTRPRELSSGDERAPVPEPARPTPSPRIAAPDSVPAPHLQSS